MAGASALSPSTVDLALPQVGSTLSLSGFGIKPPRCPGVPSLLCSGCISFAHSTFEERLSAFGLSQHLTGTRVPTDPGLVSLE